MKSENLKIFYLFMPVSNFRFESFSQFRISRNVSRTTGPYTVDLCCVNRSFDHFFMGAHIEIIVGTKYFFLVGEGLVVDDLVDIVWLLSRLVDALELTVGLVGLLLANHSRHFLLPRIVRALQCFILYDLVQCSHLKRASVMWYLNFQVKNGQNLDFTFLSMA